VKHKKRMRMRKAVLITGGAGYIGSHVGLVMAQLGYEVVVLDSFRHKQPFEHAWATVVRGDYGDAALLKQLFSTYHIHAVVHCASLIEVRESVDSPLLYYHNNVSNTVTLLQVMLEHGVKKLIFSSSCAVYGAPQQIPIPESHPTNPISPYGRTKLMIELIMQDASMAYDLQYVALRYFNAAGAYPEFNLGEMHTPETHLIPIALQAALSGKPFSIFGTRLPTPDGTCIRDFVHVRDIADAHARALAHLDADLPSDIFNLGTAHGYSVKTVLEAVQRLTQKKLMVLEKPSRLGDPAVLVADAARAHDILKWQPQFSQIDFIVRSAQMSWVGSAVRADRVRSSVGEGGSLGRRRG
jgi:UDP-glucose 4-epimerase